MNDAIHSIRERAKKQLKTIVLPESQDARVREAARIIAEEGIARVLLLEPGGMDAGKKDRYAREFFRLRQKKGITIDEARAAVSDPLYYAAMMVREKAADGFVAGAFYTTPDVARAAIRCFDLNPQIIVASSCFIMVLPDTTWGEKGVFVFADCGIVPIPDSEQLACIAISAAELTKEVLGIKPRIALLSYSTKGSGQGQEARKVRQAVELVRQKRPEFLIDGELQVDAAIVPEVARIKKADVILGGRANVLIFPNLNAGNISYKLVQRLANAHAVGPLILGLNRPCSDLSRGCSIDDIIDCVAVTAIRAQISV
ncbi:MAG: phosphate acetyltransferase [Candidatus Omnitrophota bacterium]